jgi:AAA+ superfamily predicted ATPase
MAVVWFVFIVAGVGAIISTFALAPLGVAIAVAVGVFSIWGGLSAVYSWHFGLRRRVLGHLQVDDVRKAHVLTHVIKTFERVDLQLALDRLHQFEGPRRPVFGVPTNPYHGAELLDLIDLNPTPVPLQWEHFPRSADQAQQCAVNSLYLLRHDGQPYCALVRPRRGRSRKQMELEILAARRETAQAALADILDTARLLSVYRGKVISLEKSEDRREDFTIKFHDLPGVRRDEIVLPEEVMAVAERNVLGLLAHAQTLRAAGRDTRHGVLLHGPPGTGKTLVTRYLARSCPDYTVILLTGRELRFVRESCQLARLLAPSLIIMEDVDLIATDRRQRKDNALLHDLLDEMDGLGPRTDCIFLLTSNRPEVLEPALAARPGRVDQAVYFPLPDLECRRRLFTQYGAGLDLAGAEQGPLLERTEGASPAFIRELFRKAALLAAERGEQSRPLKVTADDLERALRELVVFGGELTRQLLGFGRDGDGEGTTRRTSRQERNRVEGG